MGASGVGLIVGGLIVILAGLFFFELVIESESEAGDSCDASNVGDEAGNETCDDRDRKFLGLTSTIYIIGVVVVGIILMVFGAIKLKNAN